MDFELANSYSAVKEGVDVGKSPESFPCQVSFPGSKGISKYLNFISRCLPQKGWVPAGYFSYFGSKRRTAALGGGPAGPPWTSLGEGSLNFFHHPPEASAAYWSGTPPPSAPPPAPPRVATATQHPPCAERRGMDHGPPRRPLSRTRPRLPGHGPPWSPRRSTGLCLSSRHPLRPELPWKRWAGSCCSASAWAARSRGSWGCRCAPARPGGRPARPPCCGRRSSACRLGRRRRPGRPAAAPRSSCPGSARWKAAWSGGSCWHLRGYASQQADWVRTLQTAPTRRRQGRGSSASSSRETNIQVQGPLLLQGGWGRGGRLSYEQSRKAEKVLVLTIGLSSDPGTDRLVL